MTVGRPHVGLLFAVAALTRVVAAIHLGDRFHFIDETIYVDAARALLRDGSYGPSYANVPAHPVFLALLALPWPSSVVLLRGAHAIVTGLLGGIAVYALGMRAFGAGAAYAAAVFWALDPLLVVAGGLLYPDAFAAVVLATALLTLVIGAQDDRVPASAFAGILLGVTVLFRPVAAILLPVFVLWMLLAVRGEPARRIRHALVVALACAGAVAPWIVANLAHEGRVVPAGMAGLQSAPVEPGAIRRDGLATSLGRAFLDDPGGQLARLGVELAHFWELYPTRLQTDDAASRTLLHQDDARLPETPSFSPELRDTVSAVTFGTELVLALIGIAIGWRTRRAVVVLFVGSAFVYGLGYAVFVAKLRYRIVVLPAVLALAGLALATLRDRVRAAQRGGGVAVARRPAA